MSRVNRVQLAIYPEGGDLVVGLETRLYLEARTPQGKAADVAGRVIDRSGAALASFCTEHRGRARCRFTPALAGSAYAIVLDEPAANAQHLLPAVQRAGFAISAAGDAAEPGEVVKLRVASSSGGKARVALAARDKEVASHPLRLEPNVAQEVSLTPPDSGADGVLRATIFDETGLPRAERLLFRRLARGLKTVGESTPSREKVTVKVRTRGPAPVLLEGVDDAVLETVERRERVARLHVQASFDSEVSGLTHPVKIDLLLGTQGWRRFAFYEVRELARAHGRASKPPPLFVAMRSVKPV